MKESQFSFYLVCATNVPFFGFRIIEGRMHFHGYHCMKRSGEVRAARRINNASYSCTSGHRQALRGSSVSRWERNTLKPTVYTSRYEGTKTWHGGIRAEWRINQSRSHGEWSLSKHRGWTPFGERGRTASLSHRDGEREWKREQVEQMSTMSYGTV